MGKPTICIGKNKGADQLCSNCKADQRLCFRYTDSTIPLLLKTEISSFYPSSVAAQAGLFRTWLETQNIGFLASRLNYEGRLVTKCRNMISATCCTFNSQEISSPDQTNNTDNNIKHS